MTVETVVWQGMLTIAMMLLLVCIVGVMAIFRDWYKWKGEIEIRQLTEEKNPYCES